MLINLFSRGLTLGLAAGALATGPHASVVVESSRRTTLALAGIPEDGGGLDTDSSPATGPLTLGSAMGPTQFNIEASVQLTSNASASGISGVIDLRQRGFDDSYYGSISDRWLVWVWVDQVMTFAVDTPTSYRMEVSTLSSTWEVPPIYGVAIAAGAWNTLDDSGISFVDAAFSARVWHRGEPGRSRAGSVTAFFRFTSAYFGPNTFDVSTASLAYSLTIPASSAGALLALAGTIAMKRRR